MAKLKVDHDYKCQECNKVATHNIQETPVVYKIKNNGDFVEVDQLDCNGDNEFYCDKCYEEYK